MKPYILYFSTLMILILSNCTNSKLYSRKNYDDQVLSISEKLNKVYTRKFIRNGLTYMDKTDGKKIIERKVYLENKLLYKYPMETTNLLKTDLQLLSKNKYLKTGVIDTLQIINNSLPLMNRYVSVKGAVISRTSDSTYLINVKDKFVSKAIVYVSVSDNYEEISDRKDFISDSIIIPIK